jgi:hypothetical protein
VGGKVGYDLRPGYQNPSVDVGAGYKINPNFRVGGQVGIDANGNKRAGVGVDYKFGK